MNSLRGYLFRMLRNIFLNFRRTEARETQRRSRLIVDGPSDRGIDTEAIEEALRDLPEEQMQVVVLRIWGD